jgi:hypothetical protein
MADEEKEKAEKIAAAKKRVGLSLDVLLLSETVTIAQLQLDMVSLRCRGYDGTTPRNGKQVNMCAIVRTIKEEDKEGGRWKEEGRQD